MEIVYTLDHMDYFHSRQQPILKACLTRWFQNPKDLHLTSPTMTYPFRFQQWLAMYESRKATTLVIKRNQWIVGHLSFSVERERIHLFHIIIDRDFRGQGLATRLINAAEQEGILAHCTQATLFVSPKNSPALDLYCSLGYTEFGRTKSGSLKFTKDLKATLPIR
ncbi:MAG: GNAT family N-acetyltransferase [FCB group bacterium]|nr:GNAT family N-acetyltransferase [FCB group bacterium]